MGLHFLGLVSFSHSYSMSRYWVLKMEIIFTSKDIWDCVILGYAQFFVFDGLVFDMHIYMRVEDNIGMTIQCVPLSCVVTPISCSTIIFFHRHLLI